MQPTVLITGASSGIGLATARLLAQNGYRVVAGVRSEAGRAAIESCALPQLTPIWLDVTSDEQAAQAAAELQSIASHGLYGLVNNAGVGPPAATELTSVDELRHVLEVNTVGPLRMIQCCLPLLRQGRGRIVNISSINGAIALPMVGAYSASKFALEALTDSLRIELRPWGVPISVIRPGQVGTEIFAKARTALADRTGQIPEELKNGYGPLYARAAKFNERGARGATAPEAVARVVLKALRARRPRLRYLVGADARWLDAALVGLPTRWLDKIIASVSGADKGRP